MRINTRQLIWMTLTGCTLVGIALATPRFGLNFATPLATGVIDKDVLDKVHIELPGNPTVHHDRDDDDWSVKLVTTGPSTFFVQDVSYFPGGYTGWHSHPGVLLSTVTEGSIEWYNSKCQKHVYNVGDSLTETSEPHYVRNVGSVNARFMVTYVIAKGQDYRIDQPTPGCAASLGLY